MSQAADFILTGRPASRTTSRLYELHNNGTYNNNHDDDEDDGNSELIVTDFPSARCSISPNTTGGSDRWHQTYQLQQPHTKHNHGHRPSQHRFSSSYQTVENAAMVRQGNQNDYQRQNHSQNFDDGRMIASPNGGVMSKTRNKYRPRVSKPSECDDMLFGRPSYDPEYTEWKAPWGKSRTSTPLLFDSTDRAGHYSSLKQPSESNRQSYIAKANHKRPWK